MARLLSRSDRSFSAALRCVADEASAKQCDLQHRRSEVRHCGRGSLRSPSLSSEDAAGQSRRTYGRGVVKHCGRGSLGSPSLSFFERGMSAAGPLTAKTLRNSPAVRTDGTRRRSVEVRVSEEGAFFAEREHNGVPSNPNGSLPYLEGRRSLQRARQEANGTRILRPKRIILVRHGESEGNVDEAAYTRTPDSRIRLTQKGWDQAVECGNEIRRLIESDGEEDWSVYFYVSPYLRTIQTLRGVGLAFERKRIAGVREEPRIREQDFGNFQCREKMRVEKQVRQRFGRFFYRFPDGESAADVYDRLTGFRETLRADIDVGRFQRPDFTSRNMNLVLVSHGLTLRVFLMRWYKWTVEQFEGLYNFDNASPFVLQLGEGGRYSLRMHHSREELLRFGMTHAMIEDQEWQLRARPGDLNLAWPTSGPCFFDHFDDASDGIINDYVCDGLVDGCIPERREAYQD